MAIQTATNPQTGETVVLVNGQWVPAGQTATNDQGQKAYLVNNQWLTDQPAAPVKDAGFSLGDIAKSFGMGATGSTKALTDVAGAGNVLSSKLEGATESLQRSLTPERQAELDRQAARMKAAEESGSFLQEIKAGALNVAEAPLQSAAQAIGSFVPYLPALLAAPVAAAMRLTPAAVSAVRAVAQQAPKVIGTAQGAGAVKGSIYEGVLQAEIESGTNPEAAKQKASAAQDYFGKNFDQIALGAGLGFGAASTGVEKFLTPAGRAGAAPGVTRRVGEAVVKESLPEAAQGGQERLAQNIALQREGRDVDTFKGVAGAATQEALTGALGAAPIAAISRPEPKVTPKKEQEDFEKEEAEFRKQFGATQPVAPEPEPELPTEFPGGYTATRREVDRKEVPEGFGIFAEGSQTPLSKVASQEEADAKLQTLSEIRQQEQSRLAAESEKLAADVNAEQRKLDIMEATGQTGTDEYIQAKAAYDQKAAETTQRIDEITQRIADYSAPLSIAPIGTRVDVQSAFDVKRGEEPIGTFNTLEEAQAALQQREPELFKQAEETARVETDDRIQQLEKTLTPLLAKFNLQDVGLKVVEKIKNNAGGSYLDRLIQVAIDEQNPIQTMRHESMHALKDLDFFTPQQWKALTERANKQWIKQYLADVPAEIDGVRMSRLDAYKQMGLTQEEIVEEAISDAFGAYDRGATPPPGMIAALYKKLKNFFLNFGQALRGAGFESADDVFQRVERGELKSRKPKAEAKAAEEKLSLAPKGVPQKIWDLHEKSQAADEKARYYNVGPLKATATKASNRLVRAAAEMFPNDEQAQLAFMVKMNEESSRRERAAEDAADEVIYAKQKYSLAGAGVPMSTRNIMEQQTAVAQQDLGLNTEAGRNGSNNVRDIAKALNQQTLDQLGAMNRNKLTQDESTRIAEAIADEVAYQLGTTAKTGTGLGWYSNNYPNAVKRLGRRFPELSTNKYARSVFSALVAVTSNGERVTKNIDNAIELYTKLRKGKPLVAMGNRRASALENNLQVIQDLMDEHGPNFEKVLLQEITVKEMNARLREMGEEADGSYLANTVVPAAAVYFGPKLGAFYANLSGSEGYLTMDLWWTRSINRMRGLLIPKATEASITKFRDMMETPNATRDEVIAATIPLRNKYEEYGWNSELEHLVEAKEPSTKAAKPAWFKKAEETAGDAYEQLLFEHNLEKMANTIYKNEFEMLEEAPFTATDRKFMYDAARKAQTLLRNNDIDLSLADIQAALWYYEKRLYAKLSGRKADDIGYEEAIIAQANQGSGRARPSLVFDQRTDRGDDTQGKVSDSETVRGRTDKGQDGKFSLSKSGDGRRQSRTREIAPLEGAPSVAGFHGPIPEVVQVAEEYAKANGIPYQRQGAYVDVNPARAKRIAEAYEKMDHDPQNPAVKEAYEDLIRQTMAQYKALDDAGYKFWFINLSQDDNLEYTSSPWNAMRDLQDNKEMGVFPTNAGFGTLAAFDPATNPLLADTGLKWPVGSVEGKLQPVLANDLFRAVHDAFGHGIEGAGFRARGEENAWQAHVRLFTGPAIAAITSETRGQNSWLNYGPYGETNRTAKVEDTVFADQKTGLMPEWTWSDGIADNEEKFSLRTSFSTAREAEDAAYQKAPPSTKEFKQFFGASTIMDEGRAVPMFHGSQDIFTQFRENKPIFVSPSAEEAERYGSRRAEKGESVNVYPLWVRAETPFDYQNPEHVQQVMDKMAENKTLKGKQPAFFNQGHWENIEDKQVQDAIKALGFDSFFVNEGGEKNLGLFKAEQVKSITGNIGDFSRESKDMRFSLPNIPAQVDNRIGETTFKREEKNWVQNLMEAITPTSAAQFRAQYLNRYNQMSVYDKALTKKMGGVKLLAEQSAEMGALMSDLGSGISASAMGIGDRNGGIPVFRNGITTIDRKVKGLIASLAPLAAYNDPAVYQRYQYWAMVNRGIRLNKEGKNTGIDTADVAFAKLLQKEHPEFVKVKEDLIAFNNGLVQYMVDTGVLSKERGYIYTKHADYIPFYRQMDGEKTVGPNLFQSLSGVKPPKALKGKDAAEAPIADFLETMVRNTQSAIQAGVKNAAAQRAIGVATQVQEPGMGATRLKVASTAPNVINILEKGQIVSYETPDPLLINAMMSLNQSELPFMGIISAPANLLRTLVTKEPGFMMANLVRDSLSAWVTSGVSMTPIAGTVINFGKALVSKSPGFEALMDAGILGGYEFSANVEQSGLKLQKDLEKKAGKKDPIYLRPFTSVWDALEKGTTASDAATRVLVYERVLAETGSEAEALARALEVMNFHRKGSSPLIRVLTAAVPFFNARLQGLDLFYRASTGNMNNKDSAAIQRQFFVRGMTMMALSVAYWFAVSDDEEYQKQEQETKDNNWIIPAIGVKIPIPFEVGVLFKLIPERIAAYTFGNDTGQDLKDAMFRSAMSTFAFNPVPQAVKPVFEAAYNFNTFTWRPIVGQGMEDVAPQFQTGPGTSNVSNAIGKALGLSPMKVDHVIKGYTGTLGMYGIDVLDAVMDQFGDSPKPSKRFEQMPVFKRFMVDPEARGNVTQYYQLKDAVDTVVRTMNLLEKTGESDEYLEYLEENMGTFAVKDYVSDTEKVMKKLREAKVSIRSSSMTADEKRDALTEIGQAENAVTSQIQEIKKMISDQ